MSWGMALVAATMGGLGLAAMAGLGLLPAAIWPPAAAVAAITSVALLFLFFHPWLVLGLAIDFALLWSVAVAGLDAAGQHTPVGRGHELSATDLLPLVTSRDCPQDRSATTMAATDGPIKGADQHGTRVRPATRLGPRW